MKNNNNKALLLALSISTTVLFGACSKQISSISQVKKLTCEQTMPQHRSATHQSASVPTPDACVAPTVVPEIQQPLAQAQPLKTAIHKSKAQILLAQIFDKSNVHQFLQKTAAMPLAKNSNTIASYHGVNDGGGWIGLAIACLVIGLVLVFLGFGSLGSLFWTIGIVILVIALVFFLLWIIGRAAGA